MKNIGIALFDGFALPEIALLLESFQRANEIGESEQRDLARFNVRLLSTIGGRIASSSLVFVWTESIETARHLDRLHGLFVAGGPGVSCALRDEALLGWLRRTSVLTGHVCPVDEGRLLLDAAGHSRHALNGRGAAEQPQRVVDIYPALEIGWGGMVNPLHSALHMIEQELGPTATHRMAELLARHVPNPFTDVVHRNDAHGVSEKIRTSARWLETNAHRQVGIDEAAQIAAMSERNFLRRFKAELGVTPSDYLLYVRLDMSCRMLTETTLPVAKIARRCGIGSGGQLAKLFRKHLGKTPTAYRVNLRRPEPL